MSEELVRKTCRKLIPKKYAESDNIDVNLEVDNIVKKSSDIDFVAEVTFVGGIDINGKKLNNNNDYTVKKKDVDVLEADFSRKYIHITDYREYLIESNNNKFILKCCIM